MSGNRNSSVSNRDSIDGIYAPWSFWKWYFSSSSAFSACSSKWPLISNFTPATFESGCRLGFLIQSFAAWMTSGLIPGRCSKTASMARMRPSVSSFIMRFNSNFPKLGQPSQQKKTALSTCPITRAGLCGPRRRCRPPERSRCPQVAPHPGQRAHHAARDSRARRFTTIEVYQAVAPAPARISATNRASLPLEFIVANTATIGSDALKKTSRDIRIVPPAVACQQHIWSGNRFASELAIGMTDQVRVQARLDESSRQAPSVSAAGCRKDRSA